VSSLTRHSRAALVLLSAVVALLLSGAPASAAIPLPTVVGPLPVSEESYPFGAAAHQMVPQDLSERGYVEEEYLVSGQANVYEWPATGPATVRTAGAPYTTRVLIRRPAKRTRLSGNVVVEMLNPSNLFDLNIGWAISGEHFMRNGDVWVGITSKPVAIEALKNFDPERYASLSFANPLPLNDPRNCQVNAPDTRETERGLIWDIYTQVGAWVRSKAASNPLAYGQGTRRAVDVEKVYGFGYSQTGGYLINYINAIHPLATAANGGTPVYDGYLVTVAGGAFAGAYPINQCVPAPPASDPRRQIRNVGVPVIQIMSQSDYLSGIGSRRPDSDTPPDLFRHYEMAGAAHATPDELYYSAKPEDIVAAGRNVPPLECNEGPRSRFPNSIHFNAAFQNLDLWVRDGVAPPSVDDILVENGQPVLDEFGNVIGGLRSPYVDVPTSTWHGTATGASFCFIAGWEEPFSQELLDELYPTQGAYVRAVQRNVRELVADRLLTRADGQRLIREATQFDVRGAGDDEGV
jgi:hypothetical protein